MHPYPVLSAIAGEFKVILNIGFLYNKTYNTSHIIQFPEAALTWLNPSTKAGGIESPFRKT